MEGLGVQYGHPGSALTGKLPCLIYTHQDEARMHTPRASNTLFSAHKVGTRLGRERLGRDPVLNPHRAGGIMQDKAKTAAADAGGRLPPPPPARLTRQELRLGPTHMPGVFGERVQKKQGCR